MSDFVTLQEAKDHLRLSDSLGTRADAHVQQSLDQAEAIIAQACYIAFAQSEHVETFRGGDIWLNLHVSPVVSVASVVDGAADETLNAPTADDPDYELSGNRVFRLTSMGNRVRWPMGYDRYTVTYTGGYTGADGANPAPDGLKLPILELTRQIYEDGAAEITPGIAERIAPYVEVA